MILHIHIPHFWIHVEEQRRPGLHDRPVIIGTSFLARTAARSAVLMVNDLAEAQGVRAGISLAHARQICPEAVILSPELSLYAGAWEDVMALLLTYTPLVESVDPGEAVMDVAGCERLFGDPVLMAREITRQIESSTGLSAHAGVGSNRLVAQLVVRTCEREGMPVCSVPTGREASFLAPLPVASLPDIDPDTLISFQVLGLKTIGQLASISEAAMESRFGELGGLLARYARGRDDRPIRPAPRDPAIKVSRSCDEDGLEPHQALSQLAEQLALDLSTRLREQRLAGRLITLLLKAPRCLSHPHAFLNPSDPHTAGCIPRNQKPDTRNQRFGAENGKPETGSWKLVPDSRIHSMLPQPRQSGAPVAPATEIRSILPEDPIAISEMEPGVSVKGMARMVTSRPVNDARGLVEIAARLLGRMFSTIEPMEIMAEPGAEMELEMRHFASPEQMTLSGLDGRPMDARLERLQHQEAILTSRFGSSPFRHLTSVDLDTILQERRFRWGDGMAGK